MPDIVVQTVFMIMGAFLSVVLIQNGRQIKVLSRRNEDNEVRDEIIW